MNTVLVLVAFVAAWMVAGVILASAFGPRLRRCADAATPARHHVVVGPDRRRVEPLRWVLPASIVVMAVASSTGLAAAGVLPPRVQVVARSVFETVGLDVPHPSEDTIAEGGAATPEEARATGPVDPPAPTGSGSPTSGSLPAAAAPSAADIRSDPFRDGLAAAVAEHLVSVAGTALPVTSPPSTPGSEMTEAGAGGPPAAAPPSSLPAGHERGEADPVAGGPTTKETGRPPKHTPGTQTRPPKAPVAVPAAPVAPVAPVVEPPLDPATAAPLPPPVAPPPSQTVPGEPSPAELARQAREQRRLEKEQEKAAKKSQAEQVAPVLPPPALDPAVPALPTSTIP